MLNLFQPDGENRGLKQEHLLPLLGAGLMLAGGSNAVKLGGAALAGYGLWKGLQDRDKDADPEDAEEVAAALTGGAGGGAAPARPKGFLIEPPRRSDGSDHPANTFAGTGSPARALRSPDDVRWTRRKPRGFMADLYGDYLMSPPVEKSAAPMSVRDEIAASMFGGPAEMDTPPTVSADVPMLAAAASEADGAMLPSGARAALLSRATPARPASGMPGALPRVRGRGPAVHGAPSAPAFMGGRNGGNGDQGAPALSGVTMGRRETNIPQGALPAHPELTAEPDRLPRVRGTGPAVHGAPTMPGFMAGRADAPDTGAAADPNVDAAPVAPFVRNTAPDALSAPAGGAAPSVFGRGPRVRTDAPAALVDVADAGAAFRNPGVAPDAPVAAVQPPGVQLQPRGDRFINTDFAPRVRRGDAPSALIGNRLRAAQGRRAPKKQEEAQTTPIGRPPWLESMLDRVGPENYARVARQYAYLARQGLPPAAILQAMELMHGN